MKRYALPLWAKKWGVKGSLIVTATKINRLCNGKKSVSRTGTIKEEIDEDLRQTLIMKLLEAIPQFPMEKE